MSRVEREEEFLSEDELKALLERWMAPGPSKLLDKRVETSFAREFSGAVGPQSIPLPQTREEVVTMKFCTRCEEEFADKFSFCPVDGTPLTVVARQEAEPSLTVSKPEPSVTVHKPEPSVTVQKTSAVPATFAAYERIDEPSVAKPAYAGASALPLRDEYHLTIMSCRSSIVKNGCFSGLTRMPMMISSKSLQPRSIISRCPLVTGSKEPG